MSGTMRGSIHYDLDFERRCNQRGLDLSWLRLRVLGNDRVFNNTEAEVVMHMRVRVC